MWHLQPLDVDERDSPFTSVADRESDDEIVSASRRNVLLLA
jgi:hypothetical protein